MDGLGSAEEQARVGNRRGILLEKLRTTCGIRRKRGLTGNKVLLLDIGGQTVAATVATIAISNCEPNGRWPRPKSQLDETGLSAQILVFNYQ